MAVQDDPRLERLLECLDATSMLSNVFTFPELKDAADDYDSLMSRSGSRNCKMWSDNDMVSK